jgi:MoxR-like ATPase
MKKLEDRLLAVGYEPRREELLALAGALAHRTNSSGARALLLEGPPGCGKTALAEAAAAAHDAPLVYALLHSWSGDDDLFVGVDVAAAVAGDADHVRQPGVLARAAVFSGSHPLVVVCLDEVDKAPERAEALLLDWLQSGRVPVRPGEHMTTDLSKVLVVITSNGARPLSDALLRRVRRVQMASLPAETAVRLIAERAHVSPGISRMVWKTMREIAAGVLSLQEGVRCAEECWLVAESASDLRLILAGWAARDDEDRRRSARVDVSALWGEIVGERRRSP